MIHSSIFYLINVEELAHRLHSEPSWDWVASCIALLSLCIAIWALVASIKTLKSQKQTEKNTNPIITSSIQEFLLKEMIIKTFDGYLRLKAIKYVLDECDYTLYPSEEIIEDIKIDMNFVHIELFYSSPDVYRKMQGIIDLMKSYNTRLDILNQHLKNRTIDATFQSKSLERVIDRNIMIARVWSMLMTLVFQYDQSMKCTIFNNVLSCAQSDTPEYSYINESDFYISFYDSDDGREKILNYMNAYIVNTTRWIRDRLIQKH